MYIAITNTDRVRMANSLQELGLMLFDIEITDTGTVLVNGIRDTISYNMKEYTKYTAHHDFCNTRLKSKAESKGIRIFKAEEL